MIRKAVILEKLLHFRIRETKVLIKAAVRNGQHFEIVQSREDAFLRYPQTSRQHRKLQEIVRLERPAEQATDQRSHLLVIAVLERLVQRYIIFVDEENYLLAVVLIQQAGEHLETFLHVIQSVLFSQETFERIFIILCDLLTLHQKAEPRNLRPQNVTQFPIGIFKCKSIHVLQRHEHHRELAHIRLAQRRLFGDRQPVKQRLICADLKKGLQHAHVQRLAKAPRTREEVHFSPILEQVNNQSRFVNIIEVFPAELLKTVDAHR